MFVVVLESSRVYVEALQRLKERRRVVWLLETRWFSASSSEGGQVEGLFPCAEGSFAVVED